MQTEHAEFFEKDEILKTIGKQKVETIEKYTLTGEDLYINNKNNIIKSQKKSILEDQDGNLIYLDNFEYSVSDSLFKSVGYIEIEDNKKNKYEFTQVYVDTKKRNFRIRL